MHVPPFLDCIRILPAPSPRTHGRLLLTFLQKLRDQPPRAGVMLAGLARVKLGLDLLGQDLAQLDAPLVEAVDIPDRALGEGQVLVVDDQGAERGRGDLLGEDAGGGAVAEEGLVRDEVLGRALALDLLRRLAHHQRLRLGEEVGREHALVLAAFDWVVRFHREDEVCGDELGALVEELVERVLGVGGGFAEDDGPSGVFDVVAGTGHGFSVGFH